MSERFASVYEQLVVGAGEQTDQRRNTAGLSHGRSVIGLLSALGQSAHCVDEYLEATGQMSNFESQTQLAKDRRTSSVGSFSKLTSDSIALCSWNRLTFSLLIEHFQMAPGK